MARLVLASYVVRYPVGGYLSWILQWLVGFTRLGHEVFFVEKAGWPGSCYDPSTGTAGDDPSQGVAVLSRLLERFGLAEHWCFVDRDGHYHGLSRTRVEEAFRTADLFIDNMQRSEWWEEASRVQQRVLVDGEPGYRQMRMALAAAAGVTLPRYDHYYTVGLNIGTPASTVPDAGCTWRHVLDPVVPDLFDHDAPVPGAPWTTVMSWQAHDALEFGGVTYGQKDVEFVRFIDLPGRVRVPMEVAIAGARVPREALIAAGWTLRDSHAVTVTFDAWRDYIRGSTGEFSVAKNVFVRTNSGFFSDRSAAYLASGRPVVMQDTGFSAHLPCGEGLYAVADVEEAAGAIEEVSTDVVRHSRAARAIACEWLDATRVLRRFLDELGI